MSNLLKSEQAVQKFTDILGNESRATAFLTSVLQAQYESGLQKCSQKSLYNAAVTAAILDLPVNPNLGMAYLIPYKGEAQLQVGYKGFIQLCQRTGQYKTISATEVYEGQVISENPLEGFEFDFSKKENDKIVGYAAYFALLNGFSKTLYMSTEKVKDHAEKYSQSFRKNKGPWKDEFDAMAKKTVLKLLLNTYGPKSIKMQRAIEVDQGVMDSYGEVAYVDNPKEDKPEISEGIIEDINEQRSGA